MNATIISLDTIKANIRNFRPLTKEEKDYVIYQTTEEEKNEIILLLDYCIDVLSKNMMEILLYNENNEK